MAFRIASSHTYLGNDHWKWSAWIEATRGDLSEIERVVWLLHPTFNRSRIETTDAASAFRLDASGWGGFRLRAELHDRRGATHEISTMLELRYPQPEDATPSKPSATSAASGPYVFLSYASEDATQASAVRETLTSLGVRVRDASEIEPDLPFDAAVRKLIRESASVLSVVGGSYTSPFVIAEAKLAEAEHKPVVTLVPEGVERPMGVMSGIQELRFDTSSGGLRHRLTDLVNDLRIRDIV